VSEWVRNERQTIIATVGLSFLRYRELLGTPYAGATYISYPTAVGAAILGWHTLCHVRAEPCTYSGRSHRRGSGTLVATTADRRGVPGSSGLGHRSFASTRDATGA
jgi:hypothetical protein